MGSNSPAKKFRFFLKQVIEADNVPDYEMQLDDQNVIFAKRGGQDAKRQGQLDLGGSSLPATPSPTLIEKARRAAPGLDIYMLYNDWRGFALEQKEPPRSIDAAFLGFCKKRAREAAGS